MKFLLLLSLIIPSSFAAFPVLDVENLSGSYQDDKGTAHAMKAFYAIDRVEISHEDMEFNFNKEQKKLRVSDEKTSVVLDFDFSFLSIFKTLTFDRVDAKSEKKLFWVQSDFLNVFIQGTDYDIEDVYVETDLREIPIQDDEDITVVDGFILNAVLRAKSLSFDSSTQEDFFKALEQENPDKLVALENQKKDSLKIPLVARDISFVIKEGKFNGKALLDSWINLWLRLEGAVSSNKDNSKMIIDLQKAKLGIFSIRGILLNRVRNLNLEGVTVDGQQIIVSLDTVILGNQKAF